MQWTRNYSLDSLDYSSVSFYDKFTGFVTTPFPDTKLLKTTDGGISWTEINVPDPLNQISYAEMSDENTVWIVMNESPVLSVGANICKSDDGGDTWEVMFETNDGIRELFILDENHLWAGTDTRLVYSTVDGGQTWTESEQLEMSLVHDMYFVNPDTGWATGGGTKDVIERTTDGGITWQVQFERVNSQGFGKRIEFVNSQKGFCVGFATLMLRTLNAGETWEYLSGEYQAGPSILTGLPCTYDITDIDFVDENRGWIVGRAGGCPQPPGHFIMSTIDGGQGWKMDMLDEYLPLYGLNAVDFNEAGQGWAIGADGLLFFQEVTVGEKVVEENSLLKLFPNPAHTYVRIISSTNFNRITLYNQYGQLLYRDEDVCSGEMNLDLSQYKSGIYFIETDGKYYKIVKI